MWGFLGMLLLALVSVFAISGCAISTPFKGPGFDERSSIGQEGSDRVLIGLTYVRLGNEWKRNRLFWDHLWKVYDSMESQSGLIGFSLRRKLLGREGWTMSVWEDRGSMSRFARSDAHQTAIDEGWDAVVDSRFAVFELEKDQIPLSWKDAEAVLEERGEAY